MPETALADVPALLDTLAAARAEATPGTWEVDGEYPAEIYNGASGQAERLVAECRSDGHQTGDAVCIVAEHNAVPRLTAALRAVLALADELLEETSASAHLARVYKEAEHWAGAASAEAKAWTSGNAAARLRAAVASALAKEEGR